MNIIIRDSVSQVWCVCWEPFLAWRAIETWDDRLYQLNMEAYTGCDMREWNTEMEMRSFNHIFITDFTGSCLPIWSVTKILLNDDIYISINNLRNRHCNVVIHFSVVLYMSKYNFMSSAAICDASSIDVHQLFIMESVAIIFTKFTAACLNHKMPYSIIMFHCCPPWFLREGWIWVAVGFLMNHNSKNAMKNFYTVMADLRQNVWSLRFLLLLLCILLW